MSGTRPDLPVRANSSQASHGSRMPQATIEDGPRLRPTTWVIHAFKSSR